MLTCPVALNVSEPKSIGSVPRSPSRTSDPMKCALSATVRLAVAVSSIPPAAVTDRSAPAVDRFRLPVNVTVSFPAWPSIVKVRLKSGRLATVNVALSPPRLTVRLPVGWAKVVVSNVPDWLRRREMPFAATPSSSKMPPSAVPGRLKTKSVIVLPVISTGSRPV